MLSETENAISRLDIEADTMQQTRDGVAPPPPAPSAEGEKATSVAEPVIRIQEVVNPWQWTERITEG